MATGVKGLTDDLMDQGSISVEPVSLESGIYNSGCTIWDLKSEGPPDSFSLHTGSLWIERRAVNSRRIGASGEKDSPAVDCVCVQARIPLHRAIHDLHASSGFCISKSEVE